MEYSAKLALLDESGNPFDARIERVLLDLVPRFRRHFPALKDEVVVIEVFEEAGRRIAEHEKQHGRIERLYGYAWVTIRSVAASQMRRSSARVAQATLGSAQSETALSSVPSAEGSPEQIEADLLFREVLAQLTADEKRVCVWKVAGFSSKEIAAYRDSSVSAVDTLFFRAKQKIRTLLEARSAAASSKDRPDERRTVESASENEGETDG